MHTHLPPSIPRDRQAPHAHLERVPEGSARSQPLALPCSQAPEALATSVLSGKNPRFSGNRSVLFLVCTVATELKRRGDRHTETGRNEKTQRGTEGGERLAGNETKAPGLSPPKRLRLLESGGGAGAETEKPQSARTPLYMGVRNSCALAGCCPPRPPKQGHRHVHTCHHRASADR